MCLQSRYGWDRWKRDILEEKTNSLKCMLNLRWWNGLNPTRDKLLKNLLIIHLNFNSQEEQLKVEPLYYTVTLQCLGFSTGRPGQMAPGVRDRRNCQPGGLLDCGMILWDVIKTRRQGCYHSKKQYIHFLFSYITSRSEVCTRCIKRASIWHLPMLKALPIIQQKEFS